MRAGDAHAAFLSLPPASPAELLRGERALVLAPHPDDESLGCGGLIALAAAAGAPCAVAILTDGAASHPGSAAWPPSRLAREREAETRTALSRLGHPAERVDFLGFPDAALPDAGPGFEAAVAAVLARAERHDCRVLVAPWIADPHRDHEATQRIARAAARRSGLRLLSYPVWGWLLPADTAVPEPEPVRGVRLDVSAVRDAKRAAIAAHRTQHGAVVTDAPDAFVLPAALLDACDRTFEVFVETAA